MEEKKADRRVRYTMMVIRQSFIRLLKEKPISKITIKEICEGADVNRATFYAHYEDQYDLLHKIENEVIDNINRTLYSYNLENVADVPGEMLDKILNYIKENGELFDLLLLNSNANLQFQRRITEIIGRLHFSSIAADREDSEYVYLFFANGAIGLIIKWLKDGMKKPVSEVTELIMRLSQYGREGVAVPNS